LEKLTNEHDQKEREGKGREVRRVKEEMRGKRNKRTIQKAIRKRN